MAINLGPAQLAVRRLMTDRVRLYHNPGDIEDDTLAPDPGNLDLDPGPQVAYYDGDATIKISEAAEQGAASSLPLDVVPDEGDYLEVVASRDAGATGRWFRIDQVRGGTFSVSRRLVLVEVAAPWQLATS